MNIVISNEYTPFINNNDNKINNKILNDLYSYSYEYPLNNKKKKIFKRKCN